MGNKHNFDIENKENKILNLNANELKLLPELNNYRWFYLITKSKQINTENISQNKNLIFNIFPYETSYNIEKSFVNKFPYEENGIIIIFNYLQNNHKLFETKNNKISEIGIVIKENPNNLNNIFRRIIPFDKIILTKIENISNPFQNFLIENLNILPINKLFNLKFEEKILKSFFLKILICSNKFYKILMNNYINYINNVIKENKIEKITLEILINLLKSDFNLNNKNCFLKDFIEKITENNFFDILIKMFLEESYLQKEIITIQNEIKQNNLNLITYYLLLLFSLDEIKKNNKKNKIKKAFSYFNKETYNNKLLKDIFQENNFYFSSNMILASKNKFNYFMNKKHELNNNNNKNNEKYVLIEIHIPEFEYNPQKKILFNMNVYDLSNYSNEKIILFPCNSVFKCKFFSNEKIILEFVSDCLSDSIIYMNKENRIKFGIFDDIKINLNENEKKIVLIERLRRNQIKLTNNFSNVREIECFDEHLNSKDLEILSNNFKNIKNLEILSLFGNSFSKDSIKIFSKNLKNLNNLLILNLSYCDINDESIKNLKFSENNLNLERLILKGNSIADEGLINLCYEFIYLKNLIEISFYDNPISNSGMKKLSDSFEILLNIEIINLWNCNINNEGIEYFFNKIIEKKNYLFYLKKLILRGNSFDYKILNVFFCALKLLKNINLININQTKLEPEHLKFTHDFLLKLNKNWKFNNCGGNFELKETFEIEEDKNDIQIKKNNNIKKEKFKANKQKIQNIKTLKLNYLNVMWLQIKNDELIHLETLILSDCNINNNDLNSLSKIFCQMPLIINLNLSSNNFNSKGLETFSNNLHFLMNLYELNLSNNNINDDGMNVINNNIEKLTNIQNLIFSWNKISHLSFNEFLNKMKEHKQLQFFDFYGNLIKDNGFIFLCEEIKNNGFQILKKFNLGNNFIGNDSMKKFAEIFKKCNNLTEINLSDNCITQEGLICFQEIFNNFINQILELDLRNNDISEEFKNNLKFLGTPKNYLF